ncbi:MAG: ethanolamine utilization protein EutN [Deltaproteobacteria bacterium]|nr:ethanolamine utilization protein EutN [Deltaproteobacteria bacterium]
MLIGKVIGTVVATKKEPTLEGLKLLLLKGADLEGNANGGVVVAADAVGAGIGELVLYAAGSSARQTVQTKDRPVDHVVMAIVDLIEAEGRTRYRK